MSSSHSNSQHVFSTGSSSLIHLKVQAQITLKMYPFKTKPPNLTYRWRISEKNLSMITYHKLSYHRMGIL